RTGRHDQSDRPRRPVLRGGLRPRVRINGAREQDAAEQRVQDRLHSAAKKRCHLPIRYRRTPLTAASESARSPTSRPETDAQLLSSLMPPWRITSPQRLLSAAINAANSSGVPSGSRSPCPVSRLLTSDASYALRVCALSQSTMGRGVPAGAISPNQAPP